MDASFGSAVVNGIAEVEKVRDHLAQAYENDWDRISPLPRLKALARAGFTKPQEGHYG